MPTPRNPVQTTCSFLEKLPVFFFRKVGHFGLANLGVQGLYVLLAYASDVPGILWRERAPPFSGGSAPQTRFCLGKQYCCNTRWKCP